MFLQESFKEMKSQNKQNPVKATLGNAMEWDGE